MRVFLSLCAGGWLCVCLVNVYVRCVCDVCVMLYGLFVFVVFGVCVCVC